MSVSPLPSKSPATTASDDAVASPQGPTVMVTVPLEMLSGVFGGTCWRKDQLLAPTFEFSSSPNP